MPTKSVYDAATRQTSEVEMVGAELAAFEAQRANQQIVYAGHLMIEARVTTTGVTPAELFRRPLSPLTGYAAMVHLVGIDSGNGNMRYIRATIAAKRLSGDAILVPVNGGALAGVLADHRDGNAGVWTITPSVSGNDFIITVVGAAARTVNWFCRVEVDSFTPGGQS